MYLPPWSTRVGILSLFLMTIFCPTAPPAGAFPSTLPTKQDAALVLDPDSPAVAPGTIVRCGRGQRVGVWTSGAPQNLTVSGCEIGVVLDGEAVTRAEGRQDASLAQPLAMATGLRVEGPTGVGNQVTTCVVGIWSRGGVMIGNTVVGCQYGIVIDGDGALLDGNMVDHASLDGILVTSWQNTLVRNVVTSSGRYGLNIVASVPLIAPGTFLSAFRRASVNNTIQDNRVTGSGVVDLRQWPYPSCAVGTHNTWTRNTAGTRSAPCLY